MSRRRYHAWLEPSPSKDEPPQQIPRTTSWRRKNPNREDEDVPNDFDDQCDDTQADQDNNLEDLRNESNEDLGDVIQHEEVEDSLNNFHDQCSDSLSDTSDNGVGLRNENCRDVLNVSQDQDIYNVMESPPSRSPVSERALLADREDQAMQCVSDKESDNSSSISESSSDESDSEVSDDTQSIDDHFDSVLDDLINTTVNSNAEVVTDGTGDEDADFSGNDTNSETREQDQFPHPPSSDDEREEEPEHWNEDGREESDSEREGGGENLQDGSDDPLFYEAFNELLEKITKLSNTIEQQPKISLSEFLLNALTLVTHFKMNFAQFEGVMKLVNTLFREKVVPDTRYRLDALFKSMSGMHYHFVCPTCMDYVGKFDDYKVIKEALCKTCDKMVQICNLNECTFFVTYDLAVQIELLLNDEKIFQSLKNPFDLKNDDDNEDLRDVYDGTGYQNFISSLPQDDGFRHLSFCFSVDGAALYTGSRCEIWPLFCSLLELSPYLRAHNLLLGALWFGKGHAPLDVFLIPFAEECRKLSEEGFRIIVKGETIYFKCHCLCCCADAPARAGVQCIHQHGGGFCCDWCLHPSENRRFDILNYTPEKRTEAELKRDGAAAWALDRGGPVNSVNGVTGLSPVLTVKSMDLVNGMILEYFHAAAHGIGKTFCAGWLGSDGADVEEVPYYIGNPNNLKKIDSLLQSIRLPVEARRPSRDISEYKYWKGRDFENFILYLSVVVLMNILPRQYLQHWSIFVQGLHFLLLEVLPQDFLKKASELMKNFGRMVVDLYPKTYLTYNMHIVSEHLAENCSRWGPAWSLNGYCFEDGNRILKSQIHANNGIASQVCRALSHRQSLRVLESRVSSHHTKRFQADIEKKEVKSCVYVQDDKYFGVGKKLQTTPQERFICQQKSIVLDSFLPAAKLIHQGRVYTTSKAKADTDNSVACLKNNNFVLIDKIIVSEELNEGYIIGRQLRTAHGIVIPGVHPNDTFLKKIVQIRNDSEIILITELSTICARVVVPHGDFIIKIPTVHNTS